MFNQWVLKLCVARNKLDVSFGERERKVHRDPAENRTQDLLNTSWILLPLSHWTHGRGVEASLLIAVRLEAQQIFGSAVLPSLMIE